jgi:hypothetical protein
MQKLVIISWVLKALGIVLVLLMLFGHEIVLNLFPGLEGMSINPFFYLGILFYAAGAVIYFFVNKKERAERRRREIEESYKAAGFGDSDDEDDSDDSTTEGTESETAVENKDDSGVESAGENSNEK